MCTCIFDSYKLTVNTPLAESRSDHDTRHTFQGFTHILVRQLFAVYEMYFHFAVVVSTGLRQCFTNRFVSILQVIFSDQCDVDRLFGLSCVAAFQEFTPWTEPRSFSYRQSHFFENGAIQALCLHQDRNLVDCFCVDRLHYSFIIHITELCHFLAQSVA